MLLLAILALTPPANTFPLTIESIMRGPALVGEPPRNLKWSRDGSKLWFEWAKPEGSANPTYKSYQVNKDGAGLTTETDRKPEDNIPGNADWLDNRAVYVSAGSLTLYDGNTWKFQKLLSTSDRLENPRFLAGGQAVAYVRAGNIYRLNLADGTTTQLTDIHPATEESPSQAQSPASQSTLSGEQSELFKNFPAQRTGRRFGRRPDERGGRNAAVLGIAIAPGDQVQSISISPSGTAAALTIYREKPGGRTADVPNYITPSGYTEMIPTYRKVGDVQGSFSVRMVDLEHGKSVEIAAPRAAQAGNVTWSPDGKTALTMARSDDHKDRWILGFDTAMQKTWTVWDEHDDAWVDGPGAGLLGWTPDGAHIYFESEQTGFANLMLVDPDGSHATDLTPGKYEVSDVTLDKGRNLFLYVSSEEGPAKRQLNSIPVAGGTPQKLSDLSADDNSAYAVSSDGQSVAVVRSSANRPDELFVNKVQVTHTPTDEWLSYPWIDPPIVMVHARDGVEVPARLYKPAHWKKGGPAIMFVHGAGYLQNVFEAWSYYYREYMFHHLLMDKGYVVLDMDYRGSAGYGKAWRTAIYRHMGGKDLDDLVDGAHYLVATLGADPDRIGIYGGSYGGFLTLMAMFKTPGVFAAGAALRPVSDWANYNDGYTSPILNNPQDDPEAYKQSSPIYFADGLKGSLLICHGVVDTNVHFQDSVRLVERLIELGKTDWEVAPYPIEDHDFSHPASWIDEYRRIFALFERTIGKKQKKG
jgi:dipeptidyl aminopeptidase/acylaminoacyl peptidase